MMFVYLTLFFWFVMILYWIVAARTSSQTSLKSELLPLFKLVVSALITYLPLVIGGWFARVLFDNNIWTDSTGVLLCAAGVGVAVWARHALGRNWSGKVMVQQEHHVVDDGPYRAIRHPIYSGLLLAMVGASLILGYIFSFAYVVFSIFGLVRKSKQEEKLLANQFPSEYETYRKRTKALIPYVY
jgi:protein-S-isoprenylcysteine O-methyltransferase Ste14